MKTIKQQNNVFYLNPHYYNHPPKNTSSKKTNFVQSRNSHFQYVINFILGLTVGYLVSSKKSQIHKCIITSTHRENIKNTLLEVRKHLANIQNKTQDNQSES